MLFEGLKGISWEDARRISEKYLSLTRDFAPDYAEEMQGIAEGAEVDLLDIAALNARTEVMYSIGSKADVKECTTISLTPPATEGGRVIAAQNWDFSALLRDCVVIVHVYQEDKPNFVMVAEAGMIGGIGMNDRGIAVMLNALRTEVPCQGIPLRARMRAMLEAETLSDAYVRGSHAPVSVANLIATHKDGVAIGFEMDSETVEPLIPDDGVLVHTNHYIGPKMYLAHDVNHAGSSYIRLQRIKTLVKECYGKITVDDIMRMLRDHAGYPHAICDHEDMKDPLVKRDATNFGIIMDLTGNCMYLAHGNPCENEFQKYFI
jgi:isopenicillin-N N-acyltransferase-like protein